MADEPTREWSEEQLKSDEIGKKDIIKFIQDNAAHSVRWIFNLFVIRCEMAARLTWRSSRFTAARLTLANWHTVM